MGDIVIVGGGFSASIAKIIINKPTEVITTTKISKKPRNIFNKNSSFEINKFFGKRAFSYSVLRFNFYLGRLHDRLILGGNSNIWGGFVDLSRIPDSLIQSLNKRGIFLKKLSFAETGSISNKKEIFQLQDSREKIVDTSKFLGSYKNYFLESFFIKKNEIGLNLVSTKRRKTIYTKNLILCIGVTQTIDLLFRSNALKEGSTISLSEFSYELSTKFSFSPFRFKKNSVVIRFLFIRAILHYIGIQKYIGYITKNYGMPFYFDQKFSLKKNLHTAVLKNGVLSDNIFKKEKSGKTFGKSVHYCNLKINGINVNDYLKMIAPNLTGLGMAFVCQKSPGPISNDIMEDAIIKLKKINK